jgi:hypothetical protein
MVSNTFDVDIGAAARVDGVKAKAERQFSLFIRNPEVLERLLGGQRKSRKFKKAYPHVTSKPRVMTTCLTCGLLYGF